ncbi:AAC(3) family N-acetyltransferase [Campylobacter jejuni]|uniref:AAC(3) family N-acetyltransferase n=1 Tax=Campylobacter jejuni TaxID=197 RepID=UPI000F815036|nr:AAC(3) family N-acetyltransferase [Campylobacter jejuni]RTJ57328.1 hypothetical protein C3H62_01790 [Campylobacter jejuni]RTJ75688.1 hypothetical protein C3H58_00200 [Campylobacter jejuni]
MKKFVDSLMIQDDEYILFAGNLVFFLEIYRQGSSIKELKLVLNNFLDLLLQKANKSGIALQAFNWDFCKGFAYDILKTKSQTGTLSNIALARSDFKRTKHPIYSFAVAGKFQKELVALENKGAFDSDSPFAFMHKNNAKMIIIDLPLQHSFTFVHYVEECLKVDYRFNKSFEALYTDEKRKTELKSYSMFVRKTNVETSLYPLEKIFQNERAMHVSYYKNICIKKIDLNKAYEIIARDIIENKSRNLMFYT